jgi:type II secretory pathway pseudopilin PulG
MVELLVVMAIGAIMISLTVASFAAAGRRESREGAADTVMGMLRQARISAVDGGRGAVVRLNPGDNSIYGLSSAVLGAWHFEEASSGAPPVTPGAKRNDGVLNGTGGYPVVMPGKIGLCLRFARGSQCYVDCGNLPVWNQTDGFRIEAWVNPSGGIAGDLFTVMSLIDTTGAGQGYALGLGRQAGDVYSVHGGCFIDDAVTPYVRTQSAWTIPGNKWSHIAFEFDGYEARIFINGVLADLDSYRPVENPAPPLPPDPNPVRDPNTATDSSWTAPALINVARNAELRVGGANWAPPPPGPPAGNHYFNGMIDEPQILSIAGGQRTRLPERVRLVTAQPVVHFDGEGYLDIAYHASPVVVAVGDPYQAAELSAPLAAGDTASFSVRNVNPFPPTGGYVIIGNELIHYDDAGGLQCNTLLRGRGETAPADYGAGEPVFFARAVRVTGAGVVERLRP